MVIKKIITKRSLTSEMERNVREMQKLIEEDGDSFAQKAEMYYKKRPMMISLIEEFYRAYKSMVDHMNASCDLQSQASDYGSESPSWMPSPSPRKMGRRISSNRAPGFDVFLGGNANSFDQKDGDGSSTLTDSDEDSYDDASSINSSSGFYGNGNDQNSIQRRVMELETDITHEGKEELVKNAEDFRAKINAYEQEIRSLNDKLRLSEGVIDMLKSKELTNVKEGGVEGESLEVKQLREELRVTKDKLDSSEMQIVSLEIGATKTFETIQQLQEQLDLAQKEIASWKTKFNSQKSENTKLQERHSKMRTNLVDRDHEIRELKSAISDVEQKIFFERANMKSEISKLSGEQKSLEEKFKEWEYQCQALEEEIRKIKSEKIKMGETLKGEIELLKEQIEARKKSVEDVYVSLEALRLERDNLKEEVGSLKEMMHSRDNEIEEAHKKVEELTSRGKKFEEEIERQRDEIIEAAEEKREVIRQLCISIEHYRYGYNQLRKAIS